MTTDKKPEPAACPCGDKAAVLNVGERFRVYCNTSRCFIGPSRETEVEAIEAWNRRFVCADWQFCCNTCDHKCAIAAAMAAERKEE